MQAIYGWKKKVTLEYYSLQIIHALFQATSLPIHQNFCSIQGWETSCYSFLFSCYCSGRIIYKKSRALQVHRQRTELQPNKRSQQSHGAAHTQLSWGRGQHVRVVNSASNKEQQGFGFHPVFSAVSADVWGFTPCSVLYLLMFSGSEQPPGALAGGQTNPKQCSANFLCLPMPSRLQDQAHHGQVSV